MSDARRRLPTGVGRAAGRSLRRFPHGTSGRKIRRRNAQSPNGPAGFTRDRRAPLERRNPHGHPLSDGESAEQKALPRICAEKCGIKDKAMLKSDDSLEFSNQIYPASTKVQNCWTSVIANES